MFVPTEIIFAATTLCNLHCPHCFVRRSQHTLSSQAAINFLSSCRSSRDCQIDKVGFSGGEPFLARDFLFKVIAFARKKDFMFDQIMTNGLWWKDQQELRTVLQITQDQGYDGKIGLSYDNFHGQEYEKIREFCAVAKEIFGEECLSIQAVADPLLNDEDTEKLEGELNALAQDFSAEIFILPQSFTGMDERGWQSKKWFKEDYCQGPGQILFVHPDGNIAPCCGFANENPALFIGSISDTFEEVMKKASQNPMIKNCYEKGLLKCAKETEKQLKKHNGGESLVAFPGKGRTEDICTFCHWLCTNSLNTENKQNH